MFFLLLLLFIFSLFSFVFFLLFIFFRKRDVSRFLSQWKTHKQHVDFIHIASLKFEADMSFLNRNDIQNTKETDTTSR